MLTEAFQKGEAMPEIDGTRDGALTLGTILRTSVLGFLTEADIGTLVSLDDSNEVDFRVDTVDSGSYVVRVSPLYAKPPLD